MLHHADGDDPVERAVHGAIVALDDRDEVRDAHLRRPRLGARRLLGREGDAGDLHAEALRQVAGERAPAAAHIEDRHAGLQPELRRDMAHLVDLRLLEAVLRMGEIGA